ncbi:MAG: hypothetical protein GY948_08795 [Alphaproteobacteria bacterium]|nr:hypothetical protein [Alphaproteobacteria bacterium]
MNPRDRWLLDTLKGLANVAMNQDGIALFTQAPIRLGPYGDLTAYGGPPALLIPTGLERAAGEFGVFEAAFGAASLKLYHPAPCPDGWSGVPDTGQAVWWRSPQGSLLPAWDLWGAIGDLLTFAEERKVPNRDAHGRFPIEASPRHRASLAQVPVVNNALALLVDGAASLADPGHRLLSGIAQFVAPPAVVLSHDCDNLTGNTLWTQASRAARFAKLLASGKIAAFEQIGFAAQNLVSPERHYFDDQLEMWAAQQARGFSSVIYILNGKGGRFGARTPFAVSKRLMDQTPEGCEIGVHYNYQAINAPAELTAQIDQINGALDAPVKSGRAHYLTFDPLTDFPKLTAHGIQIDESVGWAYDNSYRAGIAGPFAPYDEAGETAHEILELPMTFMDMDLPREDGGEDTFSAMLHHVGCVGGCLTILVHPGANNNPERPEMAGVYPRLLDQLAAAGARSFTPRQLHTLWRDGPAT